jgi:two-component system, chemotaxis family, chemotaxis protein CheY
MRVRDPGFRHDVGCRDFLYQFTGATMKTILTVDDSASVRQMVKITLSAAGYGVVEAGDGRDGLAKAKSNQINMVVTDLNMPGMNGLEFIRELRQMPPYRGIPIVFLTTESDDGIKQQAKAAGATGWITKPFKQEQLLAVAKKLLGQ